MDDDLEPTSLPMNPETITNSSSSIETLLLARQCGSEGGVFGRALEFLASRDVVLQSADLLDVQRGAITGEYPRRGEYPA